MSDTVQHYHLVSAEVLFQTADDQPVQGFKLNTTIVTDDGKVTAKLIGRAQVTLQKLTFMKFGNVNISDVFIISISPLGEMTEDAFVAGVADLEAEVAANG